MDDRTIEILKRLPVEMESHLTSCLIPFWYRRIDREHGGFTGYMDYNLKNDDKAVKGCILNSRILWFFSKTAIYAKKGLISEKALKDNNITIEQLVSAADHAYDFLKNAMLDKEYGGLFWSVNYDGTSFDTTKHTYNQAFGIYGLSAYYELTGKKEAIDTAFALADIIEDKCRDAGGYGEAFKRDFSPEPNEKLSENGVMAERTMNTMLHIYEGYTELIGAVHKVSEYEGKVSALTRSVAEILDTLTDKVYNKKLHRQEVFFDKNWNFLIDLWSYGHDIEASWLFDYGMEKAGDEEHFNRIKPEVEGILREMELNLRDNVFDGHSLPAEAERGKVKENRIWWVQAETVNGFLWNGLKYDDERSINAAAAEWDYIKEHLCDRRPGSEWFWELYKDGTPIPDRPIVEEWKCPYHNGRMVLLTLSLTEKYRR